MELKELFELQGELDQLIATKITDGVIDGNDRMFLNDRITALSVEVAEFTNEVAEFKYWKQNKRNDKAKQIEEYVDILHFWLSIGNTMKFEPLEVEAAYKKKYRENIERQKNGY